MNTADVGCCVNGSVTVPSGQCLASIMIVKFVVF